MSQNPQFPTDLVTFTEEILHGKIHFLCSEFKNDFLLMKRRRKQGFLLNCSDLFKNVTMIWKKDIEKTCLHFS